MKRLLLPLLAALALGCGLSDPKIPDIAGKWTGTDNDGDRWELELTENEIGGLSGTYTLQIVGSLTLRDSITGRYEYPIVSRDLAISVPGHLSIGFNQGSESWREEDEGGMRPSTRSESSSW